MPSVSEHLLRLKQEGQKALICFVTGGDPSVESLPAILRALEAGGADVIEVGLPFSDPIADGPTIQASSQRALDRRAKLCEILDAIKSAELSIPIITMGYTNTALRLGFATFAERLKEANVSGALLSDMIPEEAAEWRRAADRAGLETVFLVAPTSTDSRIRQACEASTGFVYCVSRTGVTGAESIVPPDVGTTVSRVKAMTDLPVCVGFGISTPEQVSMVNQFADGAVVGSHIVNILARSWNNGEGAELLIEEVSRLKN